MANRPQHWHYDTNSSCLPFAGIFVGVALVSLKGEHVAFAHDGRYTADKNCDLSFDYKEVFLGAAKVGMPWHVGVGFEFDQVNF